MMHPSDTPPDGDFVRYVERLTASNAAMVESGHEDLRVHAAQKTDIKHKPTSAGRAEVVHGPNQAVSFAGIAFLSHLKWLVVGWIAIQVLAAFVPWAEVLLVPMLLAYMGWIIFRVNRNGSGALAERLRQVIAHAAEEARKAQHTHQKKKT